MGRDNQPKDRQRRKLIRKNGSRPGFDRILIVCEGEKTEPNYFNGIRKFGRLSSITVSAVKSDYGTLPQQVVDYAYDYCLKTNNKWEQVFCVFDRDEHKGFQNAIASAIAKDGKIINDQGEGIRFTPIPSVPCFELWLCLHFEGIFASIERRDLFERLKRHIPAYEKGDDDHFEATRHLLDDAFANASRLEGNRSGNQIANPYTEVDMIVKELLRLITLRSCH